MAGATLTDRLAAARIAAGHTQAECAALLTSRFDAPLRSQASMSRYLSGKQRIPLDIADAVSKYINVFDTGETHEAGGEHDDRGGAEVPAERFAGIVRRLTDEPLLGPRQGALVDAMIGRLRDGPPFSAEDAAAITATMRILGLEV